MYHILQSIHRSYQSHKKEKYNYGIKHHRFLTFLVTVIVIIVVWINTLFWNITHLGFIFDQETGIVTQVIEESGAGNSSMRAGDKIVSIYGIPWKELSNRSNNADLVLTNEYFVPVEVERYGNTMLIQIDKNYTRLSFQVEKMANILLSLTFLVCGIAISFTFRYEYSSSSWASMYWLIMSLITGVYLFADYVMLWLYNVIQASVPVLSLSFIWLSLYYPVRYFSKEYDIRIRIFFSGSISTYLLYLLGLFSTYGFSNNLYQRNSLLVTISIATTSILCAYIFFRVYIREGNSHIRRKLKLIIYSITLVSFIVIISTIISYIFINSDIQPTFIIFMDRLKTFLFIIIPISYVLGYILSDLYYIEQFFLWAIIRIIPLCLIVSFLWLLKLSLWIEQPIIILIGISCIAICYIPLLRLSTSFFKWLRLRNDVDELLQQGIKELSSTLERSNLIKIVIDTVTVIYGPVVWSYYEQYQNSTKLHHKIGYHTFQSGYVSEEIVQEIKQQKRIMTTRGVADTTSMTQRDPDLELPFDLPSNTALWCPVMTPEREVKGLFLFGNRPGFEPYRTHDMKILQKLFDAASLAFTNTWSYETLQQSEQTVRQLYQRVQDVQDETLRNVAVELHDEVINYGVRLNINALQKMALSPAIKGFQDDLEIMIETEQSVLSSLRMICERIHPAAIDDPLGLVPVLQTYIQRSQQFWGGECVLEVEHTPIPIDPRVQREAVRIVRESVTNATKHAVNATRIVVHICFPSIDTSSQECDPATMIITITDNGTTLRMPTNTTQLGIRNMVEGAHCVGGNVSIHIQPSAGVEVRCILPVMLQEKV